MSNDDLRATGNRVRGPGRDQVGTRSGSGRHPSAGTVGAGVGVKTGVITSRTPGRHQVEIFRNCLTEKAIGTLIALAEDHPCQAGGQTGWVRGRDFSQRGTIGSAYRKRAVNPSVGGVACDNRE